VRDVPPPASPLYDSGDDEPTEPSSVINALAGVGRFKLRLQLRAGRLPVSLQQPQQVCDNETIEFQQRSAHKE
jgi:hypothetical protein